MKLFERVPEELFSILAAPNKRLYASALTVLGEAYGDQLRIPEDTLYAMIRGRLEGELAEASFEGEDIDEDELRDVSGRARFLIRKLIARGWCERERGEDFRAYIIVPDYAGRMLETLHQLTDSEPLRGYSYVFGTYSTLKVAEDSGSAFDRMMAVYSAAENTDALVRLLKTVYHNVRRFFRMQLDMRDVNEVLAAHFNDFGQRVVEAYIRPLKVRDSVPKYRAPIQNILDRWAEDEQLLDDMAEAAFNDRRRDSLSACRQELLDKIYGVREKYDGLERDYLDEIDRQVRRYTRATTQKIEALTNRGQSTRGMLNELLTRLAADGSDELPEKIGQAFNFSCQGYLSPRSLWVRKRPERREKTEPVTIEDAADVPQARLAELLDTGFSREDVGAYMLERLGNRKAVSLADWQLRDDRDYVMSLLSVLDGGTFYRVKAQAGQVSQGVYDVPNMRFERKEEK